MPTDSSHDTIRQILDSIRNKRARIVVQHILDHGYITTEELERDYGYSHPPRAARDVREAGIPLETFRTKSLDGRSIAGYRFGDLTRMRKGRLQGRKAFPKQLKTDLYSASKGKCNICAGDFEPRYLQVDHRVPYEVAGDVESGEWKPDEYMLLCGSCNRAKSWSCEHCENWLSDKLPLVCQTCYWANPENYLHVALQEVRRTDILWSGEEIRAYERLKKAAQANSHPIPEYIKKIINKHLNGT